MEYTKLIKGDISYYIRTELLGELSQRFIVASENRGHHLASQNMLLMWCSDFAVNRQTNEVIKCRSMIADVFDVFCEV